MSAPHYYTLLVAFDGEPASVFANQDVLGGRLVAVSFCDEFARAESLQRALDAFEATAAEAIGEMQARLMDSLRETAGGA
ncbi:MAG TPA: hypothetical protein VEI97_18540 [bacterium]|nr:hypothetical protein [bacterium]